MQDNARLSLQQRQAMAVTAAEHCRAIDQAAAERKGVLENTMQARLLFQ